MNRLGILFLAAKKQNGSLMKKKLVLQNIRKFGDAQFDTSRNGGISKTKREELDRYRSIIVPGLGIECKNDWSRGDKVGNNKSRERESVLRSI